MTNIGLVGPGAFLLAFCAVDNLLAAVMYVQYNYYIIPVFCIEIFFTRYKLSYSFVSISMGLCACNSAGHLSNHADIAPNHAGITFAVSNTIVRIFYLSKLSNQLPQSCLYYLCHLYFDFQATVPGILCGPLTAELVTASHGWWMPVFVLAAAINFTGAIIYQSHSSALPVL